MIKPPEIRVLEALTMVAAQLSRGPDPDLAAAASKKHVELARELSQALQRQAKEPRQIPLELAGA